MTDLRIEREFEVPPETLFEWITAGARLLQWWGPEGMTIPEHDLDFSRTGPWYSVMRNVEGQDYKVSGQVTHVDPPHSVGFTWGWHDEDDRRGPESFVTLSVVETAAGARLIVDHRELPDDEIGAQHERGWISSVNSLAAYMQECM